MTNEQTAAFLRDNGFRWTELCLSQTDSRYWVYNGRSDISDLSDKRFAGIVEVYRRHGIEVTALGVFTNLLEPDDGELEANVRYFERHLELAAGAGVGCVATECGFIPGSRGVRLETYESAFDRLKMSVARLAKGAERHGVTLAIEPCVLDVIPSAKRMRDFIAQIGSDRVRVLLDPANLIANSSEEDMFRHLSPHVAYFHGKDRKVNDAKGRVLGEGEIDWPLFFSLYHRHNEGVPFILEYVNAGNARAVRDRVLELDTQAAKARRPR